MLPSTATGGTMALKARTVFQTGINIGVAFVHATTNGGHDLVDDPQQVAFVLERHLGQFQFTRRVPQKSVAAR